ncbi:uncharacterized protein I206_106937 [Kwoniella pini CBS 10737]|uniref:Nitrogen permease regulator 3 n=1 Tax=Kwoniella pini CBS 10737 TaxID=1296096 RepID=A0A1B9HZM5_9TREE|nr:uncharacterized protein I206_05520 [Kwoniella pini CBS 10737]OCF48739.1 hypothetical protein I206_05520 [Kwoniella pini CBS 10737]
MAENILGLLLVTSSSRGRAVFRYPPDPASPNIRLAQPIYPSATFTATDFDVDYKNPHLGVNNALRRKLFGEDGKASSTAHSHRKSDKSSKLKNKNKINQIFYDENSTDHSSNDDGEDDEDGDGTTSDEDSDYDVIWSHQGNSNQRDDSQANNNSSTNGTGNGAFRSVENSVSNDVSRRDSGSTTTATNVETHKQHHENNNNSKQTEADLKKEKEKNDLQYNYALGYHLDFLSDMLTPPRGACNRKFEICVGSVVFLGHPVCCNSEGKWEIPKEDDSELIEEHNLPTRGRRTRDQQLTTSSNLSTLIEHKKEGSTSRNDLTAFSSPETPHQTSNAINPLEKDDTPNLNMFHLVLIIDKPDPKPGTEAHDEHHHQTLGMYDEIYREIAFKWTAAAWKLQCESNFVGKQTWTMAKYKEKCLAEGIPITECCRWLYANLPLDRSLNSLFLRLHQLKNRPANPLHSYLPTTITTHMGDMTIHTVLSPKTVDADEAWAHWGEMDEHSESEVSDSDESEWDDPTTPIRRPELRVEPWQTLLLIDDDATQRADEISTAIIGLGVGMESQSLSTIAGERRGSKATTATMQDQEDETQLMKALIEACDVTKPLVDIAHSLRFDLEAIVIPLARELVENKKAILVDVINTRLRTVVMPTTIDEHTVSIEQYSARYSREFPTLPTFTAFISKISSSPSPFRDILPSDPDLSTRKLYMSALIWLLKQDLVVQVHTRARVFARKEVKVEAWKRLWKRRRDKWLNLTKQHQQQQHDQHKEIMKSPTGSDLVTPKASEMNNINPLDIVSVPPPNNKNLNYNTKGYSDRNTMTGEIWDITDKRVLEYNAELEIDSDEDVESQAEKKFQHFKIDQEEPNKSEIPKFNSSFIFKPSRAQKDEARWLRVIRECGDEVLASKFDLVVQYFDGMTTFEEISYRTGLPKRELEKLVYLYKEDIITFIHP